MPKTLSAQEVADFREDLCDVAAQLFTGECYDAVTMRSIAGALGVSPMTPYRYFEGKGDIYREVRLRAFLRFRARVRAAVEQGADPIESLRAISHAYVTFAVDEPGAYRIMFEIEAPQDAQPTESDAAVFASTWQPLRDTLAAAVEAGLMDGDPDTLANLCWIQVHGLASLHIAGRLNFERSLDELLEPMFETLLHGILSRPKGGHA